MAADKVVIEPDDRRGRWCIVGAGPSGLAVARAFSRAGIAYDVLEKHTNAGGIWDPENQGSPIYETAHFISSRTISGFDGFPMPDHYPDYPGWKHILEYIRAFADHSGVRDQIRFGARVESLRKAADGSWLVQTDDRTAAYRGVILATGHDWIPNVPEIPGEFCGAAYHSVNYRSPREFEGKRVLILGGGNSGFDIASDAANFADRAFISVRRGYHILPKHIFGQPIDAFFRSGPQLHARIAQPILALILRIVVGDLTRYGLPTPDHKPLESHPLVNSELLHHLAHGNITPKGDVTRLEGDRVVFADESSEQIDLIVYATGYSHEIPLLGGLDGDGEPPTLFANLVVKGQPNLFAAGHFESDGGAYPLVSKQAEVLALIVSALERSNEARRWLDRLTNGPQPDLSGGIHHIPTARHDISVQTEAYERFLSRMRDQLGRFTSAARKLEN